MIGVRGGGFRWFGQCPKENVFFVPMSSLTGSTVGLRNFTFTCFAASLSNPVDVTGSTIGFDKKWNFHGFCFFNFQVSLKFSFYGFPFLFYVDVGDTGSIVGLDALGWQKQKEEKKKKCNYLNLNRFLPGWAQKSKKYNWQYLRNTSCKIWEMHFSAFE